MLLTELKKVIDIDDRIGNLHKELADLYEERARYVKSDGTFKAAVNDSGPVVQANNSSDTKESWIKQEYKQLAQNWARYDITIPPAPLLKQKLGKAKQIIDKLIDEEPDLEGKLGVLLIPPHKEIGSPKSSGLRSFQKFINFEDYINPELSVKPSQKNWRMLVVFNKPAALDLGSAQEILAEKTYLIGGYDTRALGVSEYFALTLQSDTPIDIDSWTLLLKGSKVSNKLAASAIFIDGQYRFELDDIRGVGDEKFRPGVEVITK